MPRIQAVFTGDLIGSREASPEAVEHSMSVLKNAAQALGKMYDFDPRFTRYRGDGWQTIVPLPDKLMFACISMHAGLTAADTGLATRLAVGIGGVTKVSGEDLSDASGPAFVNAGEALDTMPRRQQLAIAGPTVDLWQRTTIELVDWIMQSWTPPQAEAMLIYLLGGLRNNTERAKSLGISRQAFDARLNGTGFHALLTAIDAFGREYSDRPTA